MEVSIRKRVAVTWTIACPSQSCDHRYDITAEVEQLHKMSGRCHEYIPQHWESWGCPNCHIRPINLKLWMTENGVRPSVSVEWERVPNEIRSVTGLSVLRSVNSAGQDPIYLVLKDTFLSAHDDYAKVFYDRSFHYESHSCPTNWLSDAVDVINAGQVDPHGIFELFAVFRPGEVKQLTGYDLDEYLDSDTNDIDLAFLSRLLPEAFPVKGDVSLPDKHGLGWRETSRGHERHKGFPPPFRLPSEEGPQDAATKDTDWTSDDAASR